MMVYLKLPIILLFLVFYKFNFGQETLFLKKTFYNDISERKTINQIRIDSFQTNISLNKGRVWLKLTITNKSKENGVFITTEFPIQNIFIYKNKSKYNLGYNAPMNERDICTEGNYALLDLKINETKDYYVQLPKNVSNIEFDLKEKSFLTQKVTLNDQVQLFFTGIFIVMFLYNLFVYFSVKEPSNLYYSISIIISLLLWLNNSSFFSRIIYPNYPASLDFKIGLVISALYGVSLILFTKSFLKLNSNWPKWNKYLMFLMFVIISVPLVQFIFDIDPFLLNGPSFLSGLILFISILILSIVLLIRRQREIRYFFIGNFVFFLFAIYFFLSVTQLIPQNEFFIFSMETGTVFQMLFFSFALADKINILKTDNELANKKVIDQLQENNQIKSEINVRLEKEVKERTFEIESQKDKLAHKNKEILDSITYAKRIQSAILPPEKLVKAYFSESFILYKPKDIVAGDFYWFEVIDDLIFFAAADCTGHGVPGALVSVVCHNALNRSVKEYNLKNSGQILDKTREIIIAEFEKSDEDVKDGMDISLCVLNKEKMSLNWSGANNPLWILRNQELIEFKGDKQPIGKYEDAKSFLTKEIKLFEKDEIYIFTDGFQDQFGGDKGKKYKISQMRELIVNLGELRMEDKKKTIVQDFETWKGDLEQVDDICIMGIKI